MAADGLHRLNLTLSMQNRQPLKAITGSRERGAGPRLHPFTKVISKQLLPVYDKPMIYYPLSILMLAGIQDILVISTPEDLPNYRKLLGDGTDWGIRLHYAEQPHPGGIAQAFIIGRVFLQNEPCCLILGDNIFYGHGLVPLLREAASRQSGATVFAYWVKDPERYGVVSFDVQRRAETIEEKPRNPKSNWAVTGLYFYDRQVAELAAGLRPSARNELEITDLNRLYLEQNALNVITLGRGIAWLDTGTHESLNLASSFIETIENRQGLKVSCPEEIAYRMGFIDAPQVLKLAQSMLNNGYGQYLVNLVKRGE